MDFGDALKLLKRGGRVARVGWNGKGMFLFLVPGSTFQVNRPPLLGIYPEGTTIRYHGHIDMKTADGMVVPWACSQTDMLADDWVEVSAAPMPPAIELTDSAPTGVTVPKIEVPPKPALINVMGGAVAVPGPAVLDGGATLTPLTIKLTGDGA